MQAKQPEAAPDTALSFPNQESFAAQVLTPGRFHADEVWPEAGKASWVGLFKGKTGFYLAQSSVSTRRVYDPVLDDSLTSRTGWQVSVQHPDSCLLLVAGPGYLRNRPVRPVALSPKSVLPGRELTFSYGNGRYRLFATGQQRALHGTPADVEIRHYRLYLQAMRGNHTATALLVAHPSFNAQSTYVLFAGDLDGDAFPDFILDTSCQNNSFIPTLYLSKPAGKGQLLKAVGQHASAGC
ncbi:hypothetical protein [Hymenobacter sp. B81]|uniref:hypothetical protein n=1 Tax=Hymenobacter sp. B81 TaxID=3344878 RepID=UPI0037DCE8A5